MRTGAIFGPIHEMSRHAIHTSEVLEASIDTLKEMQHCRIAIHHRLHPDLGETYREQAKDYAQFQISLVKALKLRSDSNQERLKNEVNLVCNGTYARVMASGNSRSVGLQQSGSPGQQRHEVDCASNYDFSTRNLHFGRS